MTAGHARFALRHAWRSAGDRAALAVCADALAAHGIHFVDADPDGPAQAVKMHGMEIADARAAGTPPLLDLAEAAAAAGWDRRLPRLVRGFVQQGAAWHGIPVGLHRANAAWIHPGRAAAAGGLPPDELDGWFAWLARAGPAPLAVGGDAFQVGLLFEALLLAVGGPEVYRSAFVERDADALGGAPMRRTLERLGRLRDFAADDALALPWAAQAARLRAGDAAWQVMGDWMRAADSAPLAETTAPGTGTHFVAIADFFVPLAGTDNALAATVARVLTEPGVQQHFARVKGALPAVRDAMAAVEPVRAAALADDDRVLPSLTLDGCCPVAIKRGLLAVVAEHFTGRHDAGATARRLAAFARPSSPASETP